MNLRRWIAAGALVVAGVAGTAVKVWAMPGGGAAGPARSTGLAQEAGGRTAGASQQVLANQARAGTGGAGGVLTLSGAQWAQLRVLYAAYRHLPVSDLSQAVPGSGWAARLADGTEWATAAFEPSPHVPHSVAFGFQDGAGSAVYTRQPGAAWRVAGLGGEPLGCSAGLPASVRTLWGLAACGSGSPLPRGISPDTDTQQLAEIALDYVGVSDNPRETTWGLDCNPFTRMVNPSVSTHGCGRNSEFNVTNASEFWCADFAKWVWEQAGVTSDLGNLNAGANSFTAWGYAHHEPVTLDRNDPAVGDVVVFFPPSATQKAVDTSDPWDEPSADHVGIVTAVNTNGTVDLVNGDFMGPTNISVQYDADISVGSWANQWHQGEKWVYVAPQLSTDDRAPAAAVDSAGNQYVFWTNSGGGLEEEFYTAATKTWHGPGQITADGRGMAPMGSEPTVALGSQTAKGYAYQYVFWEGTNHDLYEAYWNGSWHGPVPLGDGALGSQPTAGADKAGGIDVFWENLGRGLEEVYYTPGKGWDSPRNIEINGRDLAVMGSSPSVAMQPGGPQSVFWESPGASLYEAYWDNGWHGPAGLNDHDLGGPPSAGVDSAGHPDVFWESPGTGLYGTYWNGSQWVGPFQPRPGLTDLGSAPAVAVSPSGSQYVFWMGPGGDHFLYEISSVNGGSWTAPVAVGGGVPMTPVTAG
jgi:CHAP domain